MKTKSTLTYISLFSSAGVGCYGFKQAGFECVATNELIERRLQIQKFNHKCKYESGYILGDITQDAVRDALYAEEKLWRRKEKFKRLDVLIATPPCQGMSVANHKKTDDEIRRNSLVVESVKLIEDMHPRIFIFENVPAFMKTPCTDTDGLERPIGEMIERHLCGRYSIYAQRINFKSYGACSSRLRTLVIGVALDEADELSPLELFPDMQPEKTLREVIGDMKPLNVMGGFDEEDIYHAFRPYPEHMRAWIADIGEGESAFDNPDPALRPYHMANGKRVSNQQKNGDKYRRQVWDKTGPCIHTRNDQMASQNTVHPSDDRVFSIRELMRMMTIPDTFHWMDETEEEQLRYASDDEKRRVLKKTEMNIRQSIGEAVPTVIFYRIAKKIAEALQHTAMSESSVRKLLEKQRLSDAETLLSYIRSNPDKLSKTTLAKVAEYANAARESHAAYYTDKSIITEMMKSLPEMDKEELHILEPAVGVGGFIPLLCKRYEGKRLIIDVMDIDETSLQIAKTLLSHEDITKQCEIRFVHDDFLLHRFRKRYDLVIGNPPFYKLPSTDGRLSVYRKEAVNTETTNLCSFFMDKALALADRVAFVFPKFLLNTPEFALSRKELEKYSVECILDFGEHGFKGVLVETIGIVVNTTEKPAKTKVKSIPKGQQMLQTQRYIFDNKFPYWVIYRNKMFDDVCKKLDFDRFRVFRDRQVTNRMLSPKGEIRVLKSQNISDTGTIQDVVGYDAYISGEKAKKLSVYAYLDREDVYLTPNMTYKPRVMKKPGHVLVNGSLAILIPKKGTRPTNRQLTYFSSDEYRAFYQVARNYQTRSLNVDSNSVFFYGLLRKDEKQEPITGVERKEEARQLTFTDYLNGVSDDHT